MYGTKDAAQNWQETYSGHLKENEFEQRKANPCVFKNINRNIITVVHGDDYISVARRKDIWWLKEKLENRFDMKTTIVGNGSGEKQSVKVLNRIITKCQEGYHYEADPKHVPIVVRELGIEGAKSAATPAVREEKTVDNDDEEVINATLYRSICARLNYLSMDRPDIQYAV